MIVDLDITTAVRRGMELLVEELKGEIKAQGHVLTGGLINSLEVDVEFTGDGIRGVLKWNSYGNILERGVKPGRIPFTRGSGAKSSKYIEGLIRFFKIKGLPTREATGAAFATANKQKREGMPTRNSFKYSSNGRRTGMIERVVEDKGVRIVAGIQNEIAESLQISLTQNVSGIFKQVA